MAKIKDKSAGYANSEVATATTAGLPSLAPELGSRIALAADAIGTRKSAAVAIGASVDSLQRYIRAENMPPFDVAARLCMAAGRSMEWLATGIDGAESKPQSESPEVRAEELTLAIETVERGLEGREEQPTAANKAKMVMIVLELLRRPEGRLPMATITRLIKSLD